MAEAYIAGAVRTAGGRKKGYLSGVHPADLGGRTLDALVEKTGIDPAKVDDVVFGCVSQSGEQSGNIARNCVLSSGFPESVPGTSVDRQCGSGQQAIHFAVQAVMSGTQDLVIAGGVESMTRVPMGSSIVDALKAGHGQPFNSQAMVARYPGVQFSQFTGAEMLAKKHGLSREELDEFAYASHVKAARATEEGRFEREIAAITVTLEDGSEHVHAKDEGIRYDASLEKMQGLEPLNPGGLLTAASSSQICDGASALLIANERGLTENGLKPRARFHTLTVVGDDPVIMLEGPIPATQKALARAGLKIEDFDVYEVNEAFAPVPLSWAKVIGADRDKLNVNGGAMALGHPLGATGGKLMTTLLHELERIDGRYGLLAICEGGGTANCTIIERLV
ncbi:MAG: acetyl-CoA C-acetyltransferase [Myxococcales bacterium]|nr:acetyl-CoA C-acetyltransferase [Myxococcales bacterium]